MSNDKKIKSVSIFYSYSHKDGKYQQQLMEALSPLRQRKLIHDWYDGKLRAGDQWEPIILEHLKKADIILLLISASFVNSRYCYSKEMEIAVRRDKRNEAIVIPIIIRDVHWKELPFSYLQAIPKGGKPVNRWRPREAAWKNICEYVEEKIKYLSSPRPVNDILTGYQGIINSAIGDIENGENNQNKTTKSFPSISAFWEARASELKKIGYATVAGTFSQFAPMMFGPPKSKRRLHKEFRLAIQRSKKFSELKRVTINACLSVSAGQMVWRFRQGDDSIIHFGLYNSIVRNSIPVIVKKEYYERRLKKIHSKYKRETFEAVVKGKIISLDNTFIRDFFIKNKLDKYISPICLDDLTKNVYGLLIDGVNTGIEYKCAARYLDGDIWIAVETRGREHFLTTFLDISNPIERDEELYYLIHELQTLPGFPRLIARYDESEKYICNGYEVVTKDRIIKECFRFGFG